MEQFQKIDPLTFNPAAVRIAENNYASEFYRKIIEMINDFEASLNHDEEVGETSIIWSNCSISY
jgi:hypothetical protein